MSSTESFNSFRSSLFEVSQSDIGDQDLDYFQVDIKNPFLSIFEDIPPLPSSPLDSLSVPTPPEGSSNRNNSVSSDAMQNIIEERRNMNNKTPKNNNRYAGTFERLQRFSKYNPKPQLWKSSNQITPLSQIPKNEVIQATIPRSTIVVADKYKVFGINSQDAKSLVLEPRDIEENFDMEIRRGNVLDRYSK